MFDTPRSERFDDVYFSAENGLEETKHVFLKGNNLPERWKDKDRFVICETGFGTGLNFLATWKLFIEQAEPHQRLNFISFEKFPLDGEEIFAALQGWKDEFDGYLQKLVDSYPMLVPGFHRVIVDERVHVTLVFDDVNEAIPEIEAEVDAWFLDGFKPSTNPDMWSDMVFQHMARLSRPGTSYATFTAAGAVRRGLIQAGFSAEKVPGYGSKRDMTIGQFSGHAGAGVSS